MRIIAALLLATVALPALAQAPTCKKPPTLTAPWTNWAQTGTAKAGVTLATAPILSLGKPITTTLQPNPQVRFPAPSSKNDPATFGGLLTLSVETAAHIGIALSGPAWIDVVDGGTALISTDHGHGPECSGIRKIVWFDLMPGTHIVQIAGAPTATIRVMAAQGTKP